MDLRNCTRWPVGPVHCEAALAVGAGFAPAAVRRTLSMIVPQMLAPTGPVVEVSNWSTIVFARGWKFSERVE